MSFDVNTVSEVLGKSNNFNPFELAQLAKSTEVDDKVKGTAINMLKSPEYKEVYDAWVREMNAKLNYEDVLWGNMITSAEGSSDKAHFSRMLDNERVRTQSYKDQLSFVRDVINQ